VFFNGSNTAEGRYSYAIFDIAPNDSLTVSGFYRINERVPANSKQTNNDTLAIMEYAKEIWDVHPVEVEDYID